MPPPDPRCLCCNYILTGLSSNRCPECGRPFDFFDPTSFHTGPPLPRLTRALLRPMGPTLPIATLPILLTLLYATGLPTAFSWPQVFELNHYFNHLNSWSDFVSLQNDEKVFVAAMISTAATVALWLLHGLFRLLFLSAVRSHINLSPRPIPQIAFLLQILLIVVLTLCAWPKRLANIWTESPSCASSWTHDGISPEQKRLILQSAVLHLRNPAQRLSGLSLLSRSFPEHLGITIRAAIDSETDQAVLASEIRLLGLLRDEQDGTRLERFLNHPNSQARAAAADALSELHNPGYLTDPWHYLSQIQNISINPPISLEHVDHNRIALPPSRRAALLKMMLSGPSTEEREAAARALVPWPPEEYRLRVAEWGVWLGQNGGLKLIQSEIDQIPPFVHRTGDSIDSIVQRLAPPYPTAIAKPILHITANQPMSVGLEVKIHQGRPWFAYPLPDDYAVSDDESDPPMSGLVRRTPWRLPSDSLLKSLDPTPLHPLENLRPTTRGVYSFSGPPSTPAAVGLCWKSLIISPVKLPWMTLPHVPSDLKFQWWSSLRNVNSCWISSRNESERFLYYDGPTLAPAPITIHRDGQFFLLEGRQVFPSLAPAFLIRVTDNHCNLQSIPDLGRGRIDPATLPMAPNPEAAFQSALIAAGLTPSESQGLLDSWSTHFFHTPGTRILVLLPRNEYDRLCPVEIHPTSTELVRVGILPFEM